MNKYIYVTLLLFIYIYYSFTHDYFNVSIIIFVLLFIRVLKEYGSSVNITNLIQLHSSIVYLIAPAAGYLFFNVNNPISKLWVAFMPVSAVEYYSFMVPALISFYAGLELFNSSITNKKITKCVNGLHENLKNKKKVAYVIIFSGFVAYYFALVVPQFLAFVFNIIFLFIFPGVLYLVFNTDKNKVDFLIIFLTVGWIFLAAIKSTMFTIVMYMGITVSGLLLYNLKMSFFKKIILSILALYFILITQYTKFELRKFREEEKSVITVSKFFNTFIGNTTILYSNMDPNLFFPLYIRINQGRLTANVLKNIPYNKPIDKGERLFTTILSSVIPRLFWQDKPMAGGRFNMKYYANIELDKASMNVGPIGEAYGSFGFYFSFIYLFLFGSFISLTLRLFLRISLQTPVLILWLPVLFFQTIYCSETDSLQVFNSIFKTAFLLYIIFKLFPLLILDKNMLSK